MAASEKLRQQWCAATEHYKEKPGTARLDTRISDAARKNLIQRAQALSMSQKDYLEYLLTHAPLPLSEESSEAEQLSTLGALPKELSSLAKVDEKGYQQMSFKQLLGVIKQLFEVIRKYAFWMERLQKVNEALVKRVAHLERK